MLLYKCHFNVISLTMNFKKTCKSGHFDTCVKVLIAASLLVWAVARGYEALRIRYLFRGLSGRPDGSSLDFTPVPTYKFKKECAFVAVRLLNNQAKVESILTSIVRTIS